MATFTDKEADRFAALMAGFDINESEPEAMNKGRAARRMAAEKGLRLVDVLELPEIQRALDRQMRPNRKARPCDEPPPSGKKPTYGTPEEFVALLRLLQRKDEDTRFYQIAFWVLVCGALLTGTVAGMVSGNWALVEVLIMWWGAGVAIAAKVFPSKESIHARKH